MADGEGRFFFTDLPAGDYYLQATKDGYAQRELRAAAAVEPAASASRSAKENGGPISNCRSGSTRSSAARSSTKPASRSSASRSRRCVKNVVAGRTRYGEHGRRSRCRSATTDDRGMFRLPQLTPGTYVVVVPSTQTTLPAAWLENPDTALRNELFWGGIRRSTPLGQPRTQQIGDFALMTLNQVLIPPPAAAVGTHGRSTGRHSFRLRRRPARRLQSRSRPARSAPTSRSLCGPDPRCVSPAAWSRRTDRRRRRRPFAWSARR